MKLLYSFTLIFLLTACAGMSQFLNDNQMVSRIALKDATILAIGKSSEDPVKRTENAAKLVSVVDSVVQGLEGESAPISKEGLIALIREEMAKQNIELYMKIVLDDLIIVLDEIYTPEVPTVEIPAQYKADVIKALGYIKEGAAFFQ